MDNVESEPVLEDNAVEEVIEKEEDEPVIMDEEESSGI